MLVSKSAHKVIMSLEEWSGDWFGAYIGTHKSASTEDWGKYSAVILMMHVTHWDMNVTNSTGYFIGSNYVNGRLVIFMMSSWFSLTVTKLGNEISKCKCLFGCHK